MTCYSRICFEFCFFLISHNHSLDFLIFLVCFVNN
jgi:hypothetical protein